MSITYEEREAAAQALCDAGRELYERGLSPATSGNFSVRVGDGSGCAITVSGRHKGRLTPADIMTVDLQNRALEDKKPSAETCLHTQLYRLSPEVGAVLHTHSQACTVLSRRWPSETLLLTDYELLKAFEGFHSHEQQLSVPLFPNTQELEQLEAQVAKRLPELPEARAYLIRGHGAYVWARSLEVCLRQVEALEFLLSCELEQLRLKGA